MGLYAVVVSWLRFKLSASEHDVEAVADALELSGALAVSIESASEAQRLQGARESIPLWDVNHVVGLFRVEARPADILDSLCKTLGVDHIPYETDRLDDADWEQTSRTQFTPVQIAAKMWVVPSWHEAPDRSAINIIIDPGLAFGTGTHPTTQLCLAWLTEQTLAEHTVIDYGCGSGILTIAALKLGAARAIGVDTDAQALAVSRDNTARNGVGDRFIPCLPEALAANQTVPIMIANILSETLIALAPELTARVAPGGRLVLSGILVDQADEVIAAFSPTFKFESRERGGWVLLAGSRER